MADRDTIIEAMAEAMWLTGEANRLDAASLAEIAYDAALPLIRNAALEEAAKVSAPFIDYAEQRPDTVTVSGLTASDIAAAIRALKDTP